MFQEMVKPYVPTLANLTNVSAANQKQQFHNQK